MGGGRLIASVGLKKPVHLLQARAMRIGRWIILLTLLLPGCPAGGPMTKGTTRIGDVVAGMVKQSDDHEEKNDPTPIVLWSAQGQPAAILYYSSETDAANRSGVQKISRIPTKGGARVGKAGSWFGDFPVKVKLRETDEKGAPPPDPIELRSIVNADIDGDGIDELVFARRLGGVSVYSAEKLLFQHKHQEIKPDQYNYEFLVPFKVGLEKADVLFVVVNRSLAVPESDLPPGEKAFHEKTEAYLLLMLDASGITPVRLQNPAWKIGRVAGVGAVSGREDRIEELVAFIEKEGESQLYLSRHRPDGSAIAPPRKVYVPGPNFPTLETLFVPGASRVVMADRANAQIYFTAREKAANWFRVVDLKKKLPGNEPIVPLRAVRNGAATLALVRQGKQVYALDEEGQFYGGMGKVLSLVQGRKPCLSFGSGDDYELVNVVAPEKGAQIRMSAFGDLPVPPSEGRPPAPPAGARPPTPTTAGATREGRQRPRRFIEEGLKRRDLMV
jgi:hypothetical protein